MAELNKRSERRGINDFMELCNCDFSGLETGLLMPCRRVLVALNYQRSDALSEHKFAEQTKRSRVVNLRFLLFANALPVDPVAA